ncbi:Hypothetical protein ACI5QM_00526 [Bacillus subtilis]
MVLEGLVFLFPIVKAYLTIKDSFDNSSRKLNVKKMKKVMKTLIFKK